MSLRVVVLACMVSMLVSNCHADDCTWLFTAYEGIKLTQPLTQRWSACSGTLSIFSIGDPLSGFRIPDLHVPTIEYTPPAGSASNNALSQAIKVMCDVFTSICDNPKIFFVVKAPNNTFAPTTSTTTAAPTPVPNTTTAIPTPAPSTPAPTPSVPVVCTQPAPINTVVGSPTSIPIWNSVSNCVNPSLALLNSSSALFSVSANGLTFDALGSNTAQGYFSASVSILCGNALVCTLAVYVVAAADPSVSTAAPTTFAPAALPSCVSVYGYEAALSSFMTFSLVGIEGATTCPTSSGTQFVVVSPPRASPAGFSLNNLTGVFTYQAPSVTTADAFVFQLVCGGVANCQAFAYIVTSAAYASTTTTAPGSTVAPATPAPTATPSCSGNFSYVLYRTASGAFSPQSFNVFASANATVCRTWGSIVLQSSTQYGIAYVPSTAQGVVSYALPSTDDGSQRGWDNFTFVLTCTPAPTSTYQCQGTGQVLVLPAPTGPTPAPTPAPTQRPPVYRISDELTCTGTCDQDSWKTIDSDPLGFDINRDVTPRKDGRGLDEVDYYIGAENSVFIVAFAKIGNMAARFPTFLPISSTSVLTSAAAVGADVAFDPSCLDLQGRYGIALALWTWTNMSALEGYASNWYASDHADYYQKFGGKHVDCNTFRNGACQYAPLMNPSNVSGINWRLMIDGCDATWYAEVPLATLKGLTVNGSAVFANNGNDVFTGTIYSEVMKPQSWLHPSAGTAQLSTAHSINIVLRPLLNVSISTVSYTAASTGAPPSTTLSPTLAPDNSTLNATLGNATTSVPSSTTPSPFSVNATPYTGLLDFSADVSYTSSVDATTGERLFNFNVFMFPNTVDVSIFEDIYVTAVRLGNVSLAAPTTQACPQCTGSSGYCVGLGADFTDSCGASAMVSFTPSVADSAVCPNATVFAPVAGVSNVVACPQKSFNISFSGRVNGAGSASSVADMEGFVSILVDLSNGQTVSATIGQHDYISQASPTVVKATLCRSTPYAPVVDPIGVSTPVNIYSPVFVANASGSATQTVDLRNSVIPTYTSFMATTATTGTMCATPNENTFGPQDWVYVTIDELQQPNISLEYLILAVSAKEVVPNPVDREFVFLLEGALPSGHQYGASILDWKTYASFINFRTSSALAGSVAFVPGTLLRAGSSSRVEFVLQASIKTPNGSSTVRFIIPVSKSINAALRNEKTETSTQTYSDQGLNSTDTHLMLILMLILALIVVITASIVRDTETRQLFGSQLGALLCCVSGAKDQSQSSAPQPKEQDARIESYVTTVPKPAEKNARTASPQRKALTPAAAAAAAKRSTESTKSPQSPQMEERRVKHDE